MNGLQLRPLGPADEVPFVAAHNSFVPRDFAFALGYQEGFSWMEYLDLLESNRISTEVTEEHVPATFLVADMAGQIVGRTSIRHELNAFLFHEGGHIGFGVVPEERRKGYATEILLQSLQVAAGLGIDRVLVACDESNVGSSLVIERCGGVLDSVVRSSDQSKVKRYWIG